MRGLEPKRKSNQMSDEKYRLQYHWADPSSSPPDLAHLTRSPSKLTADTQFANVWSLLAKRYANQDRIIFGIMNEPHDLDISLWGASVQAAVNAIRAAGATSQSIALPGDLYTHPEIWYQGNNAPVVVSLYVDLPVLMIGKRHTDFRL